MKCCKVMQRSVLEFCKICYVAIFFKQVITIFKQSNMCDMKIIAITALLHRFWHFVRSFFCVVDVLLFVRGFIQKAFQIFDQMCVRYVSGLKLWQFMQKEYCSNAKSWILSFSFSNHFCGSSQCSVIFCTTCCSVKHGWWLVKLEIVHWAAKIGLCKEDLRKGRDPRDRKYLFPEKLRHAP